MVVCYIGLGSNIGDRQYYINAAVRKLKQLSRTKVRKISKTMEAAPQGGPVQGPYLNAVAELETDLGPYQLLSELQSIESALGRIRTIINGPRTIDLDILTYGDVCMAEEALCIPHPRMLEREFVLVPLAEVAPQAIQAVKNMLRARQKIKRPARKAVKKAGRKAGRKRRS
ncbi:MAG: 2-amino-4-hydroxy-6-hydroxymethyldihydropteridine diphosphokinase [Candidatus Omnitrophica bacterium]|nr:2-amino-4-hydroxy-6-hydroxymethyldihydropteridine diphosphokinase [Candidatus Omnitrophota bacterium]MDD5775218.1 2-amino-4-hydroxy-6-hydroxymethyldihydropteridine diphosphokinase [Candidatus Omnitrophota bacterium]